VQPTERLADQVEDSSVCQRNGSPLASLASAPPFETVAIIEAVETIQARYQLFPTPVDDRPQTVIVGVSGGADSLCLLHLLHHLAAAWRLDLQVAHLDHALRANSAQDADFVQALAAAWHLPCHHQALSAGALAAAAGSVETAARVVRQQFLAQLALSLTPPGQVPIVALAHHADDQAETVLHHLVRGSGLHGLRGMLPVIAHKVPVTLSEHADAPTVQLSSVAEKDEAVIRFVRPFLYVRRATILQHLRDHQLEWREDQSNDDEQYTRNYLRHTVLPSLTKINPAVVDALGRVAAISAEETARLAHYDRQQLAALQWPQRDRAALSADADIDAPSTLDGRIVLDLTQLRRLPLASQRALLRQALWGIMPTAPDVSFAQLTRLCAAIATADSGGPHPFVADLLWSVVGATATRPALLSLHRRDRWPFVPAQPRLFAGEVVALPAVALGECAQVTLANGWQLTIRHIARSELPADWLQRDRPWRAFLSGTQAGQLRLTTPTTGQQFTPLGLAGRHKHVADLFTDLKIPVAWRPQWPLLVDAATQEILWVCGLRLAHCARITTATTTVIELTFEHNGSSGDPTGELL